MLTGERVISQKWGTETTSVKIILTVHVLSVISARIGDNVINLLSEAKSPYLPHDLHRNEADVA
jgi:hypothetical protein